MKPKTNLLYLLSFLFLLSSQSGLSQEAAKPITYSPASQFEQIKSMAKGRSLKMSQVRGGEDALLNATLRKGDEEALALFVKNRYINVNKEVTEEGWTYLEVAAKGEPVRYQDARMLIKHDTKTDKTALGIHAIDCRDAKLIGIIDTYANVNRLCFHAAKINSTEIFNQLVSDGLRPWDNRILYTAIENLNESIIRVCLSEFSMDALGGLEYAIEKGERSIIKLIIPHAGATVSAKYLIDYNYLDILKDIISMDVDMEEILVYAYTKGNTAAVSFLLQEEANPNVILESVIKERDELLLEKLYSKYGGNPDLGLSYSIEFENVRAAAISIDFEAKVAVPSYLKLSVEKGNISLVRLLVENGSDPQNGLMQAISSEWLDILNYLISQGGDIKPAKFIELACSNGNMKIVELLVKNGSNPQEGINNAVANNHVEVLDYLIEEGANVKEDKFLLCAIKNGFVRVVDLLLRNQANPNPGLLPAVTSGQFQIVKLLLNAGGDATDPILIETAVKGNQVDITSELLSAGANANLSGLLSTSVENNWVEMTTLLLENGADATPIELIQLSVHNNWVELTRTLLEAGADAKPPQLLQKAVQENWVQMASTLIKGGADPKPYELIHLSVEENREEMVKVLLEAGADASEPDLVAIAVKNEYVSILALLTKHGGDVTNGKFLAEAVASSNYELTKLILDQNGDVSYTYGNKQSLLHRAVFNRDLAIVELLATHPEIKIDALDHRGNTPLHLAA
ncbi:MAG: ankyrin repeat domain-containing protein, partial [Bacteroidota bacterium]